MKSVYNRVNGELRLFVYNGDSDPVIQVLLPTANWTRDFGFYETFHWRPWEVDGSFAARFQGSFDFLTIRGAGQVVIQGVHDSWLSTLCGALFRLCVATWSGKEGLLSIYNLHIGWNTSR